MELSTDISTWRILVVDDEPDNLSLITDTLEFSGANVAKAEGGARALELITQYNPNLILLDIGMPGIDGWEVHRQLRLNPNFNHIPIIALTALAMKADGEKIRKAGFDGYITKPFRLQTLLDEMTNTIQTFQAK